jgi:hypothetical protein
MVYQDKFSKFNQLIANCVIYSTALDITATTNGLVAAGHPVDPVDLATVTPLITHTVRRFGDWHLDLTPPEPGGDGHRAMPIDRSGESLALLLRTGSAGANTTADHLQVLEQAITQIPTRYRRDLLITVDGAGASHGLVEHISALNARPGYGVHYSIGCELGARERTTLGLGTRLRLGRRPR